MRWFSWFYIYLFKIYLTLICLRIPPGVRLPPLNPTDLTTISVVRSIFLNEITLRGKAGMLTWSSYKVVQIWPGLFVCKQVTVCPGHIWTTFYYKTGTFHWLAALPASWRHISWAFFFLCCHTSGKFSEFEWQSKDSKTFKFTVKKTSCNCESYKRSRCIEGGLTPVYLSAYMQTCLSSFHKIF